MNNLFPLKKLLEALDMVDLDNQVVIHKETLEIFIIDDMSLDCLNRYDSNPSKLLDWEKETAKTMDDILYDNPEKYFKLPTRHELNDYAIMERFIETLPKGLKDVFYDSIQKKGAFSNFQSLLIKHHLRETFFEFKALSYREMLIKWCQSEGIHYE